MDLQTILRRSVTQDELFETGKLCNSMNDLDSKRYCKLYTTSCLPNCTSQYLTTRDNILKSISDTSLFQNSDLMSLVSPNIDNKIACALAANKFGDDFKLDTEYCSDFDSSSVIVCSSARQNAFFKGTSGDLVQNIISRLVNDIGPDKYLNDKERVCTTN